MIRRKSQSADLSYHALNDIIAQGLADLRHGAAFGGTLPTGRVARSTASAPSQGGRPVYREEDVVKDALREARQEGQRLSPWTKKGQAPAACADLGGENVAQLADELDAAAESGEGIPAQRCRQIAAWLRGG